MGKVSKIMATTSKNQDSDVEINKTITVVAYLRDQDYGDERDAAHQVDSEVDLEETTTRETVRRYLRAGPVEKRIYDSDEWHELNQMRLGDAKLVEEKEVETDYANSVSRVARDVGGRLMERLDDKSIEPYDLRPNLCKVYADYGDCIMSTYPYFDRVRMLKHQSEIDGEPFVDDETEYYCLKYKFNMDSCSELEVEMLTDEIVKPFIEMLTRKPYIGRVRWMDCEVTTTEKGVCYNI